MRIAFGDILVGGLGLLLLAVFYLDGSHAEWLSLGLIILAGIPHGSLDLRAAERWWGSSFSRRCSLLVGYVTVGLCMSALCLLWPGIGLSIFLIISAIHFTEGERPGSSRLTALTYGVGAIFLPISFHFQEAAQYLSFFATDLTLSTIGVYAQSTGTALSVLITASLALDLLQGRRTELFQRLVCLAAWILLPPLAGFSVWFIGRHSRQHLERSRMFLREAGTIGLPLDFIALSVMAIALIAPLSLWFDMRDIHQLFAASIILIAGLTLPHMLVTHLGERNKEIQGNLP